MGLLDRKTIFQQDGFWLERLYFRGWQIGLEVSPFIRTGYALLWFRVKCISDGLTGEETVLTLAQVKIEEVEVV